MLLDEIKKSTELALLYKSSSKAENYLKDLEHVSTTISDYMPQIHKLLSSIDVINKAAKSDITDQEKIIRHLNELKNQLDQMESKAILTELGYIKENYDQVKKQAQNAWNRYRSDHFVKNDNMICALCNVIDSNDQKLDQLSELRKSITKISLGNENSLDQIKKYEKLSGELIRGLKMDNTIETFVMKLARGENLYLKDLDDNGKIISWLKAHQLLSKIVISLGSY